MGVKGLSDTASRNIGLFLASCFLISSFFFLSICMDHDVLRLVAISTAPLLYGNSAVVFSTRQRIGHSPPTSLSMDASHSSFHHCEDDDPSFFFFDPAFLVSPSFSSSAAAGVPLFLGEASRRRADLPLVLLGEALVSWSASPSTADGLESSDFPSDSLFDPAFSFLARSHNGKRRTCLVLLPR